MVIPKEIRRTLRIREGDPLEIYTERDGEVIFKKYSPMGDLAQQAAQICEAILKNTGHMAAVADRDSIIAVAGGARRELMDKRISQELLELMEQRRPYRRQAGEPAKPASDQVAHFTLSTAAPILSEGDLMGCVMLLAADGDQPLTEMEQKLVQTVAAFLGRQMES